MIQKTYLAFILIGMLLLTACGEKSYEPQAINPEKDICVICKMAVKDDQFATQIVTKDGQSLKFDDIGCLNTWKKDNGTDTIGAAFVRDYSSKQWIKYEKAFYAYDPSYKTPMAYGIVSFEQEADAKAFIAQQGKGKLMSSADLANHTWEVNRSMMKMDNHGSSQESGGGHPSGMPMQQPGKGEAPSAGDKQSTSGGHGS
jgi:copper chaperone NosL